MHIYLIKLKYNKTYKVITTYKPKAHNELYLKPNDYIFSAPINLLGNTGSVKSLDNFIRGIYIYIL